MDLAVILGRTPQLAQKELEALAPILPHQWIPSIVQPGIMRLNTSALPDFTSLAEIGSMSRKFPELSAAIQRLQARLGGVVKIAALGPRVHASQLAQTLERELGGLAALSSGKFSFGISIYGGTVSQRLGIQIKQGLRAAGVSARFVEPKDRNELSSAQIFHNDLPLLKNGNKGADVVLIGEGGQFRIGLTLTVQDIDSYAERDFKLPYPDPVSGMLPPKLAQTMVNLAVGPGNGAKTVVYDPFCGNGRVVLEAALMGFTAFGSDIVVVKEAQASVNLEWLRGRYKIDDEGGIWLQDAGTPQDEIAKKFKEVGGEELFVVAEPYLGRPLRAQLKESERGEWLGEVLPILERFLATWQEGVTPVLPKRMVIVFPSAKVANGKPASTYDVLVDRMYQMGYSPTILSSYARPDAFVSRDIVQIEYSK